MKKLSFTLLALAYLLFFVGWLAHKNRMPATEAIREPLYSDPVQTPVEKEPFTFEKNQNTYTVQPVARYELYGLIVSERRDNFLHRHANDDYINTKDICVIWGDNLHTSAQHNYTFKNNTVACFYEQKGGAPSDASLKRTAFSNNHLITDDPRTARRIKEARPGDQIHLRGYLSHYATNGGCFRQTSTRRTDTGNGACETIFVTEFDILEKSSRVSVWLFAVAGILLPAGVLTALFNK
jgi:hypothetical protein